MCPVTGLLIEHPSRAAAGVGADRGGTKSAADQARRLAPRPPPRSPLASAKPPPPVPRAELVGGVIGDKYAVKGILGEGGMGVVYDAEHMAMGRVVAIKVLHPENAQKREAVTRLQHEAKVTGNLGHPNICEIYDMGRLEDGSPYVVMERLRGETLAQKIKRDGKVEPAPVVEIAMQVLSALAAAHASGIIHRDLKPENVFLAEKPGGLVVTKLLDFGISKAMMAAGDEDRLGLTQTGMVMGTPYYMAPEQARGDRALDNRVDIWAVGVMMYEAMTGRRPFLAKNYNALLVKILTVWHRSLAEVDPTIPPALALVVDKALSKMPEDRYRNATEMQDALKRFLPRKEVSYPASFALQTVRPAEPPPPPAKPAPPTFGLPELDLHDETADGVPWTAVKQYVPTAQRVAVSEAIAKQASAQPTSPSVAPAVPAPQARDRNVETPSKVGIPAPRPTPVMQVPIPLAARNPDVLPPPAARTERPPEATRIEVSGPFRTNSPVSARPPQTAAAVNPAPIGLPPVLPNVHAASPSAGLPSAMPTPVMSPPPGAGLPSAMPTPVMPAPGAGLPSAMPTPVMSPPPAGLPAPPRAARRAPTGSSPAATGASAFSPKTPSSTSSSPFFTAPPQPRSDAASPAGGPRGALPPAANEARERTPDAVRQPSARTTPGPFAPVTPPTTTPSAPLAAGVPRPFPPQVSQAPVAGQASPQFAPRSGPAARVSQPAARVRSQVTPPVPVASAPEPPAQVDDEATIMEESSDGDDDDNETLVLVRDKLSIPKKQA